MTTLEIGERDGGYMDAPYQLVSSLSAASDVFLNIREFTRDSHCILRGELMGNPRVICLKFNFILN